jgi:monoamine oxidase
LPSPAVCSKVLLPSQDGGENAQTVGIAKGFFRMIKVGDLVLNRRLTQTQDSNLPQPPAGQQITRRRLLSTAAAGAAAMALPRTANASSSSSADVIVVGAGFSGLAAARAIAKGGKSVIVLEARDRVGGKVLNEVLEDGDITEAGGTYIGPTQTRMAALAKEYGVATYPTYSTGNTVTIIGGTKSEDGYPPALLAEYGKLAGLLDAMSLKVPVDAPWTAANAAEWDSITLYSWLVANDASADALEVFSSVADLWGAETRDVSLLFALYYIAAAGNESTPGTLARLQDIANGAQQLRFVGGSQLLAQLIAKQLGNSVIFNAPARAILWSADGASVISDSQTFQAKQLILAISPALAAGIQYEPKLTTQRAQFLQRYPMGSLIKVEAVYSQPFWRAAGFSGVTVMSPGPVRSTFDNSPQSGHSGILIGFVGGTQARAWSTLSAADRRAAVLGNFAAAFGAAALSPTDYFEFEWPAMQWSRGGPVGYAGPGVLLDYGATIREPVGPIHWAGTEASTFWNGYMEGAVRSGERAAREVLQCLG